MRNNGKGCDVMSNKDYRFSAMKAATDLGYGETVINRILQAKSDIEIEQIMCSARNNEQRKTVKRKEQISWFQSILN